MFLSLCLYLSTPEKKLQFSTFCVWQQPAAPASYLRSVLELRKMVGAAGIEPATPRV